MKGHAARAVAGLPATATDWDKAVAVERWVKANMKAFEFSQAMATADNVREDAERRLHRVRDARGRDVPGGRRAVADRAGLVYARRQDGKPYLAYHMWFEVFAEGQWLPLDATLGMGGVGPGHVKITDHSWHDEKSFAPLLPVLRSLTAKPVRGGAEGQPMRYVDG